MEKLTAHEQLDLLNQLTAIGRDIAPEMRLLETNLRIAAAGELQALRDLKALYELDGSAYVSARTVSGGFVLVSGGAKAGATMLRLDDFRFDADRRPALEAAIRKIHAAIASFPHACTVWLQENTLVVAATHLPGIGPVPVPSD